MITELSVEGVNSYGSRSTLNLVNKTTLIYGLNGAGKSTISGFLYEPAAAKFEKCEMKVEQNCEILVYSQKFLQDYFYEDDSLKGIFTLSKENKDVLQQIDAESMNLQVALQERQENDKFIADVQAEIQQEKEAASSKVWEIKTEYSGGDRVLEFCLDGLKRKEVIFQHLIGIPLSEGAPTYTVDELKAEASSIEGESAIPLAHYSTLFSDWIDIEKDKLWSKVIVGSQDGSVAEFIAQVGNSDWVKQGLQYVRDVDGLQACPFCQEKTITLDIINSISGVFDDAYEEDVDSLESLKREYELATSRIDIPDILSSPLIGKEVAGSWAVALEALNASVRENILLISNKIKSPSAPIALTSTANVVGQINKIVDELNKLIIAHNDRLANKKKTKECIKLRFWSLMRWSYDQTLSSYLKSLEKLNERSNKLSQEGISIDGKVSSHEGNVSVLRRQTVNIQEAVDNINRGLVEIGIDGFSVVPYGESLYRVSRPSDKENAFHSLSEGEKTVISFLYFMELCKGQKAATDVPKSKVVVVDDPISSLSHLYVFNIGQLIKRNFINNDAYRQVIVLTHSLYFFYELTHANHKVRAEAQNLFRVLKNSNGSSVVSMRYEEIQNDYQSYWAIIKDPTSSPALIANCMRNIVEYFFNFVQKMDFNNVFQMPALATDKFHSFYRYMNRESHSLGQNIFDIKEFDYSVFKDGLRLIFEGCGYPEHYKAMMK